MKTDGALFYTEKGNFYAAVCIQLHAKYKDNILLQRFCLNAEMMALTSHNL